MEGEEVFGIAVASAQEVFVEVAGYVAPLGLSIGLAMEIDAKGVKLATTDASNCQSLYELTPLSL